MVGRFRDDSGVILDVWKKMSKIVIFDRKKNRKRVWIRHGGGPQGLKLRLCILQDVFSRKSSPDLLNDDENLLEVNFKEDVSTWRSKMQILPEGRPRAL